MIDTGKTSYSYVLSQLENHPTRTEHWISLILVAMDQKEFAVLRTFQILTKGLEALALKQGSSNRGANPQPMMGAVQERLLLKFARNPTSPKVIEQLGVMFLREFQMPETAEALIRQSLCFDPSDQETLASLQETLAALKDSIPHGAPQPSDGLKSSHRTERLHHESTQPKKSEDLRLSNPEELVRQKLERAQKIVDSATASGISAKIVQDLNHELQQFKKTTDPAAASQRLENIAQISQKIPAKDPSVEIEQFLSQKNFDAVFARVSLLSKEAQWSVLCQVAEEACKAHDRDLEIRALQAMLDRKMRPGEVNYNLSVVYEEQGDLNKAYEHSEVCVGLEETARFLNRSGALLLRMHRRDLAQVRFLQLYQLEKSDKAIHGLLSCALEEGSGELDLPNDMEAHLKTVAHCAKYARLMRWSGNDDFKKIVKRAVILDPADGTPQLEGLLFALENNELEEANERAGAMALNLSQAWWYLAIDQFHRKKFDDCYQTVALCSELNPALISYLQSLCYFRSQQREDGLACWQAVTPQEGTFFSYLNCSILTEGECFSEAMAGWEQLVALPKAHHQYWSGLIQSLSEVNPSRAEAVVEQACLARKMVKTDADTFLRLAPFNPLYFVEGEYSLI